MVKRSHCVVVVVSIVFLVLLFGLQGFFADEFQYFQSYGEGLWTGSLFRLPLVPFLVRNVFGFLGLPAALTAFKVFQWLVGLSGAFFLGKVVSEEGDLSWLFVMVLGTFYFWVFYAAKVLTDALLVGVCLWSVALVLKARQQTNAWSLKEFQVGALVLVLFAGLMTKVTFLGLFPFLVLVAVLPPAYGILASGAGFWIALMLVDLSTVQHGGERYFLPAAVLLIFGALALVFVRHQRAAWLFAKALALMSLLILFFAFPADSRAYGEYSRMPVLSGRVTGNMGDYAKYYCPACDVVDYMEVGLVPESVDWMVYHYSDLYNNARLVEWIAWADESACFERVFVEGRLVVFENVCA